VQQQELSMPDAEMAKLYRVQAETALRDPFWPQSERERRADYYRQKAERIERGENL
jgi:hypothetical protein